MLTCSPAHLSTCSPAHPTTCSPAHPTTCSPATCPDLLVLADLHGASSVRGLALKFIVDNGKEIVAQQGWRDKLKVPPPLP